MQIHSVGLIKGGEVVTLVSESLPNTLSAFEQDRRKRSSKRKRTPISAEALRAAWQDKERARRVR